MRILHRYVGIGILIGFLAGIIEAAVVNRTGFFFIPYAALAYAVILSVGFLILGLLGRLLSRNLLSLGIGAAVAFFIVLEAAFWLNKKDPLPAGSLQSMIVNVVVLAVGIGAGILAALRLRSHLHRGRPVISGLWLLGITMIVLGAYFIYVHLDSEPGTNCILISIDALRPDHLGCYGYHRETSPNIDRLAREGTLWLRAFTPCPGSTGGHASILTGLYTLTHGAYVNAVRLPDEAETAAEVFKENGYSTAAFTRNWYISPAVGFGQGFDCFVDKGYGLILKIATPKIFMRGLALSQTILRVLERSGYPSHLEIEDALDWIRARYRHSFFLFLHIMDTHSPYIPPRHFAGRFGEGDLSPGYIQRLHDESLRRGLSEDEARFLVDRYDEEILSADHKVGMLIAELRRLRIHDKTMIIVLADHGEVLAEGAHKQFGHGTLDYGSLRIPLVMWLPGRIPPGQRYEGTVQSVDVLPTMTDILGIDDPVRRQGLPLFAPGVDSLTSDRPAFATGDILARDEYTVITPGWQYMILGDEISLHNLQTDPYDAPDVIGLNQSIADSLGALLEAWMDRSLADAVVPFSIEGRSVTPGREALERLKALGYIQ